MSLAGSGEELITACAKKSSSKAFYAENPRSILSQKNIDAGLTLEKIFSTKQAAASSFHMISHGCSRHLQRAVITSKSDKNESR